jgi:hypothetical protein
VIFRPIRSLSEALASLSVERTSGQLRTNFFPDKQALQDWIDLDSLFLVEQEGASVLLRRDRDFFHVMLTYGNNDSARLLLAELPTNEILVADVISRAGRGRELLEVFAGSGFTVHRLLRRLRRPPADIETLPHGRLVGAGIEHVSWLLEMLETHFDRYSEQLPHQRQLERAALAGQITLAMESGEPAAFLYRESTLLRSTLRYWFVAPEHRDARVGAELIRTYLSDDCRTRSSELWVVDDNSNAIKRYLHYGYQSDELTNHVLMRGEPNNGR